MDNPTLFRAFSCPEQCLLHHYVDRFGGEPSTDESSPWFWVVRRGGYIYSRNAIEIFA